MPQSVAVWMVGQRAVEFRPEPIVEPRAGQVQVKTIVSAISHGTELLVYRGEVPEDLVLDLPALEGSFQYPIKYGYACVGDVVAVGNAVDSIHPGQRVFAFHPHQSEFTVDQSAVVAVPDRLPPERVAFLANLETAVNVMLDTPLSLGETVAIFGLGTIGQLLTALVTRRGGEVIAVDPVPRRRESAFRWGARWALGFEEDTACQVRGVTDGRGVDVAIEASGQPNALQCAIDSVAFQGTVIVASWYGKKSVVLSLGSQFHRERLRIHGSQVSTIDPALTRRWDRQRRMALAIDLLDSLRLEELVSHRFAVSNAAAAYNLIDRSNEHVQQVIIDYPENR